MRVGAEVERGGLWAARAAKFGRARVLVEESLEQDRKQESELDSEAVHFERFAQAVAVDAAELAACAAAHYALLCGGRA